MTAQLVQPACLSEAIERIRRQFDPVRIILFGSWARGQARPESSWDLPGVATLTCWWFCRIRTRIASPLREESAL